MPAKRRFTAGFTLLELMLVIIVIGILIGAVMPSAEPGRNDQLKAAARIIVSELAYARGLAVTVGDTFSVTFQRANNRLVLKYAGGNVTLEGLPITAYHTVGESTKERYFELADLPTMGVPVKLAAVAVKQAGYSNVNQIRFNATGGTVSAWPTTVWLLAGTGTNTRYIAIEVNPATGIAEVGAITKQVPNGVSALTP